MISISNYKNAESRLNNLGFFFVDQNIEEIYVDVNKKYNIEDNNGYKYYCCLKHIFAGIFPNIVGKSNPYSIHNIQKWITNNQKSYILISNEFVSAKTHLKLQCEHGHIFFRSWNQLKSGWSCRECRYNNQRVLQMRPRKEGRYLSYDDPITLDWSDSNKYPPTYYSYKSGQTIHWCCHVCHYEWDTSISHRTKDGSGCPKCSNKMSKSEKIIAEFLTQHSIKFIQEYTFIDCRDKNPLPFDFFLPDYNTIIEYDGIQHFQPINFSKKSTYNSSEILEYTKFHDKLKNEYCKNNNITLYRISYKDNLEQQLFTIIENLKMYTHNSYSA